jgi:hypothetical protein
VAYDILDHPTIKFQYSMMVVAIQAIPPLDPAALRDFRDLEHHHAELCNQMPTLKNFPTASFRALLVTWNTFERESVGCPKG